VNTTNKALGEAKAVEQRFKTSTATPFSRKTIENSFKDSTDRKFSPHSSLDGVQW